MSDSHQPPVKPVDRLLLNAATVARVLDLPITTVYEMIRDGRLPSVQIDGRMNSTAKRMVPWTTLQAWIRQLIKTQIDAAQEGK